jgi:hypothetical protein
MNRLFETAASALVAALHSTHQYRRSKPSLSAVLPLSPRQELWDAFQALTALLLEIMGAALGMEADWAKSIIATQGITNMVAAHYPAADTPPPPGTLRVAPHSDTSVLTGARASTHTANYISPICLSRWSSDVYMARACAGAVVVPDAEGLQVLRRTGEWEELPMMPGALVVNLGDFMEVTPISSRTVCFVFLR